jgi:hypothetical protein
MAVRARHEDQAAVRLLVPFVFLLSACGGGAVAPEWQSNAANALGAYQSHYLRGDTRAAQIEFDRARAELRSTGRGDLVARAELIRCATRAASLEFDNCPEFEKLRVDAGAEELAYADFLFGKAPRTGTDDPLSRLVSYGIEFRSGKTSPQSIAAAIDLASAQGWRRPLLAWLGVEEKRAEAAGDLVALERIRRRIALLR